MNELYQITPKGHDYLRQVQNIVATYHHRHIYAPAQSRYRLGVLETLAVSGPLTRDGIVTRISEILPIEKQMEWPLRAKRLREAIARQFEWLLANGYIEEKPIYRVVSEETVRFDPKTMGSLITGLGEYRDD